MINIYGIMGLLFLQIWRKGHITRLIFRTKTKRLLKVLSTKLCGGVKWKGVFPEI